MMTKYQLVSLSAANKGAESKFQEWYRNEHVPEVLQVPGVRSAEVLTIGATMGNVPWGLMAVYELDTDKPEDIIPEIQSRLGAGTMRVSDSIDMTTVALFIAVSR